MSEQALMAKIKAGYGQIIREAVNGTAIPEALVAALIANETGGNGLAVRFEPGVYRHLAEVLSGAAHSYGQITKAVLAGKTDEDIRALATSWGATQIMGYNALAHKVDYLSLPHAEVSIPLTVRMLGEFAHEFGLAPGSDAGALLKCWNCGNPNGKTFDPLYVVRGTGRMKIYAEVQG
jgi:hypothetical protein